VGALIVRPPPTAPATSLTGGPPPVCRRPEGGVLLSSRWSSGEERRSEATTKTSPAPAGRGAPPGVGVGGVTGCWGVPILPGLPLVRRDGLWAWERFPRDPAESVKVRFFATIWWSHPWAAAREVRVAVRIASPRTS
jgi:hypothetical protein